MAAHDLPVRGAAHDRLEVFVGTWHAEGTAFGSAEQDPDHPRAGGVPWVSNEVTRWHDGRFFLLLDEVARSGAGTLRTHAILGYDADAGSYYSHAVEDHGFYRRYTVNVDGAVWTFDSGTERATVTFDATGDRQTVVWTWKHRGRWLPLCDRTNVRVV